MPRKTELEILSANINALDQRTRTPLNSANLRLAQEPTAPNNAGHNFFKHWLNTTTGDLYFWNIGLQQWDLVSGGGPSTTTQTIQFGPGNIGLVPNVATTLIDMRVFFEICSIADLSGITFNLNSSVATLLTFTQADLLIDNDSYYQTFPLNIAVSAHERLFLCADQRFLDLNAGDSLYVCINTQET